MDNRSFFFSRILITKNYTKYCKKETSLESSDIKETYMKENFFVISNEGRKHEIDI